MISPEYNRSVIEGRGIELSSAFHEWSHGEGTGHIIVGAHILDVAEAALAGCESLVAGDVAVRLAGALGFCVKVVFAAD